MAAGSAAERAEAGGRKSASKRGREVGIFLSNCSSSPYKLYTTVSVTEIQSSSALHPSLASKLPLISLAFDSEQSCVMSQITAAVIVLSRSVFSMSREKYKVVMCWRCVVVCNQAISLIELLLLCLMMSCAGCSHLLAAGFGELCECGCAAHSNVLLRHHSPHPRD